MKWYHRIWYSVVDLFYMIVLVPYMIAIAVKLQSELSNVNKERDNGNK